MAAGGASGVWAAVLCALVACGLAGCAPPPMAWPVGGSAPEASGATTIEAHGGGATPLPDFGGSSWAGGAQLRHQLEPQLSLGAGLAVIQGPVYAARAHGRLHSLDGLLAPTVGLGGGSDFDGLGYLTADLALPVGRRFGDWELYGGPGVGLSLVVDHAFSNDALFLAGMAGAGLDVAPAWRVGLETGVVAVDLLGGPEGLFWYGAAGLYLRHVIGGAQGPR